MADKPTGVDETASFGILTKGMAGFCHRCPICPSAARNPGSAFEQLMRWHRTWCPFWAAHTKVYGLRPLS